MDYAASQGGETGKRRKLASQSMMCIVENVKQVKSCVRKAIVTNAAGDVMSAISTSIQAAKVLWLLQKVVQ